MGHTRTTNIMKTIIAFALLALAAARPDFHPDDVVPIVRSEIIHPDATGQYSIDVETGDGIQRSESGVGSGANGAVESQGVIRFEHPDGTPFELKFVADAAGGYQPESIALPVAPAFPHPIPQFVLDQIRSARKRTRTVFWTLPAVT